MMQANYQWQQNDCQKALAQELALDIVQQLNKAIDSKGQAVIAFSGGSTPKPLFEALQSSDIDWTKVVVTLVDERWVPIGHELSNAGFLIDNLLSKLSAIPKFVPLFNISAAAMNAEMSLISVLSEYCHTTKSTLGRPREFDVVILGMGGDGHTASIFPDCDGIEAALDENSADHVCAIMAHKSKVTGDNLERITLSFAGLLQSKKLILLITGDEKLDVYRQALSQTDVNKTPISAVLQQQRVPVHVYWAP